MSFVIFTFVAFLWSPSGGMETPTIQLELTRAACEADRQQFIDTLEHWPGETAALPAPGAVSVVVPDPVPGVVTGVASTSKRRKARARA